jgi:hypothetical protein
MENKLFEKGKFYIIRADKAGLFMGKIEFIDANNRVGVRSLRRLYYWKGALDASQIAKCGVTCPDSCKFSEQLSDEDLSIITNLVEIHPMTNEAVQSINNVRVWKN